MISAPAGEYAGHRQTEIYVGDRGRGVVARTRRIPCSFRRRTPADHAGSSFLAKTISRVGDFMAYEVVTDLRHTRYLNKAPDINTWAVAGPGAIRGLHRLHGRPYKKALSQEQACEEMRELLALSRTNLPDFIPPWNFGRLNTHSARQTNGCVLLRARAIAVQVSSSGGPS